MNRSADLDEQIERETQIADFVVSEAGSLSEKIPVIGQGVSKGLDLGKDSIVEAIVDGDYEVSPRFPTYTSEQSVERNFRLETMDFMLRNDPEAFNGQTQRADLRTLVDGGALTIVQDGRELGPSEIGNDFVIDDSVELSLQEDPGKWEHNEDRALSGMDDALGNIMDATVLTANSTDPHTGEPVVYTASGDKWVSDFTGQYSDAYKTTRDYFGGELETFGKPPE